MAETLRERMSEEDVELLAKLEEQNKLIESDFRGTTTLKTKEVASRHSSSPKVQPKSAVNHAIDQVLKKLSSLSAAFRKSSIPADSASTPAPVVTEEDVYFEWSAVIAEWDEMIQKRPKHVRQLIRDGVPDAVRGLAWQLISKSFNSPLKETYAELLELSSPCEKTIQRDIARTFPQHDLFKDQNSLGQESLFNVVKAYSLYDKEVGYCQGSPFIVGILLMVMPEEEAFSVFVSIMKDYGMRRLFTPSMAHLNLCFYLLEYLMQDSLPELFLHFQAQGFHTSLWASSWFLTMFATSLPVTLVFRIIDLFFLDGMEILFKFGIALLDFSKAQLLQMDMEGMQRHFQKDMYAIHERNPEQLISLAMQVKYNAKKIKRIEREYEAVQLRSSQEAAENARLRVENRLLQDRVTHLELESSSLAGRLIERQVDLAQEAEDIFVLKRELAELSKKLRESNEKVIELKAADEFLCSLRSRDEEDLDDTEATSEEVKKLRIELEVLKKKDKESQRIIGELQDEADKLRWQFARKLPLSSVDVAEKKVGMPKEKENNELRQSDENLKNITEPNGDDGGDSNVTQDSEQSIEKQWV